MSVILIIQHFPKWLSLLEIFHDCFFTSNWKAHKKTKMFAFCTQKNKMVCVTITTNLNKSLSFVSIFVFGMKDWRWWLIYTQVHKYGTWNSFTLAPLKKRSHEMPIFGLQPRTHSITRNNLHGAVFLLNVASIWVRNCCCCCCWSGWNADNTVFTVSCLDFGQFGRTDHWIALF